MDFEGLESLRVQYIKVAFEGMANIVNDGKTTPEQKIAAAKLIDGMSDTIVKAYMMSDLMGKEERKTSKLLSQVDRLMDRDRGQE